MKQTDIFKSLMDIFTKNISNLKDHRKQKSNLKYSLKDIVLSAFSVFYFQNKSWLDFQRDMDTKKGFSNAKTMFDIKEIPSDNHIRNILDKISPTSFECEVPSYSSNLVLTNAQINYYKEILNNGRITNAILSSNG